MTSLPILAFCAATGLAGACAPGSLAQDPERDCTPQVEALTAAIAGEGPRGVLFAEHLQLLRESLRRGEDRLCRDLADDLRTRLSAGEV